MAFATPCRGRLAEFHLRRLAERPGLVDGPLDRRTLGAMGPDEEAREHAGDGRVETGAHGGRPQGDEEDRVGPDTPDTETVQGGQCRRDDRHGDEKPRSEFVRIGQADHADGNDVVDHRQGEEEDPKLGGEGRSDHRQGTQHEGRVGPDDESPAVPGARRGDQEEDERRKDDAAEPGEGRQ